MARLCRLLRVVVIFELGRAAEIDHALFARGDFAPVFAADMHFAHQRASDRARMRQPVGAADVAQAIAFGARIIFVQHRPPPFDHLAFHFDRARRRSMDRALHRRHVVFRARFGRQLQHAHEHGRHPLAAARPVFLDESERLFRIEMLHHHDRAAQAVDRHAIAQRRRMIERRGREIDRVLVEPEQ